MDSGHQRDLDVARELPDDEAGAAPTTEQMAQILALIAGHVLEHRTTLVFVNTRRMAERVAHQLGELLAVANHGEDEVAAHHGSLSKDRRLRVEARLRSGDLKALVATASLEQGIDIGPVGAGVPDRGRRAVSRLLQWWDGRIISGPGRLRGGCTRRRGTSWWSARRCCGGFGGST